MYGDLYKRATQAADDIIQGNYQRRRPSAGKTLIERPPMPASQPKKANPFTMDEGEDPMMEYLVAVKQQNAALKEAYAQAMGEGYDAPEYEGDGGGASHSVGPAPTGKGAGYQMSQKELEGVIAAEASKRNIDPAVAIKIFRHEGAGAYQSQIARSGKGSAGGKEASYGPYQLYTGGGLGNQYEKATGRHLPSDNTTDGVINQVRFALDAAVDSGWTPWYGRGPAGVGERDGLKGAVKVGNWG